MPNQESGLVDRRMISQAQTVSLFGVGARFVRRHQLPTAMFVVAIFAAPFLGPIEQAVGLQSDEIEWNTGNELSRALHRQTRVTWPGNPLKESLLGLANNQQVAMLLDRRVDPDQEVTFASSPGTLDELLQELAAQLNLEYQQIGPICYIGPTGHVDRLATQRAVLVQSLTDQDRDERQFWRRPIRLEWETLDTPRDVITQFAAESGVTLEGIDLVPHDLWAGQSLPDVSPLDGLCLLLGGFELTVEFDAESRRASIIPLPEQVSISKSHTLPRNTRIDPQQLRDRYPDCEIEVRGSRVVVDGGIRAQNEIAALLRGEAVTRPRNRESEAKSKTYTLQPSGPVSAGSVIATVAQQLELRITATGDVQARLRTMMEIDLREVSLEELLHAVLDPLDVKFEIRGQELRLRPAEAD